MPRPNVSSAFSQTLRHLFHGAPNRRARRALRRNQAYSRPRLECLESRVLLSSYIIQDLGTVAGGTASQANAINALGDVVGSVTLANGNTHAALWALGKPVQDLGTLGGANSSASAINILGEIVGSADTASAKNQPFDLQPAGKMTNLNSEVPSADQGDVVLNNATGVSDLGVIVGQESFTFAESPPPSPYAFDPAQKTLNELDASDFVGQATAVSGTMAVANLTNFSTGKTHAVVEDSTPPINPATNSVSLPAIANQVSSEVFGISAPTSAGTQLAVGEATDSSNVSHLVLWTIPTDLWKTHTDSPSVLDLSSLPSSLSGGEAVAVNTEGDVVGTAFDKGTSQADPFVSFGGGAPVSLNSLLPPDSGITLTNATGINDSGQICADGTINGQQLAFLLTPVPTAPPQATLTNAPILDSAGAPTYSFTVTYADETGIDSNTLANAIQVTGPNSFSQTATLASTSGTANQLAATYTITAPGGTWDFTDNGTYKITLNADVVKNISGQPILGGTLGFFVAAINVKRASVSGTVFNDINANGKQDAGEGGLPNTDVFLDLNGSGAFQSGDPVTTTDANGNYSFPGLLPGTYNIREVALGSHVVTSPSNGVHTVTLSAGENVTGQNFGDVANPEITIIAGQSLSTPSGKTAQFDQPATTLHISGFNFAANDIFYFGNDQAIANLTNLQTESDGLQTFDLQVPQFGTTGALVVFDPQSNRFTKLLPTFTVDSYRNVNGFSFNNDGKDPDGNTNKNFSFTELTDVYGSDQTKIDLGLGSVDNPLALLWLGIINLIWTPSNGLCLGFSVASARLSLGLTPTYPDNALPEFIQDFPTTDTTPNTTSTVWQLENSNPLREMIRLAQLEQTSVEVLSSYVTEAIADEAAGQLGVNLLVKEVKSQVDQGLPCPIGMLLPDGGHCVLCYNVQDNPNGSVTLDVYDPDLPFDASSFDGGLTVEPEDNAGPSVDVADVEDGEFHADIVSRSTITFGTDGHWAYDGGAFPSGTTGGLGSIVAIPLSLFDSHTLLASGIAGLLALGVFGGAAETQVTDSAGHTLLNADGTPNTDPNTMLPNAARFDPDVGSPPLDLIQGTGNFLQTITGTGSGTYTAASLGPDAAATISGVTTVKGQIDKFGLDPSNDKLTFTPGANKELNADLIMNAADGSQRQAQLSSTASSGAAQTLQFQGDHVVYHNAGSTGTFSLSLTSNASGKEQTFFLGGGSDTITAGDTIDVTPSDWKNLQNATATVKITHADGTTTTETVSNGGAGLQVNASEGVSFTAPVATFTNQTAVGKTAVIDWGDGTTSTGTVVPSGTNLTVFVGGSHTYAQQGYYSTSITLSDANGPLAQASGEAVVAFNPFTVAPASISAFAGVPFSGTVATLTDIPSGEDASAFDVKINWGDGTTSAGTLQETSAGKFDVQGSHTWATTGTKSVTVTGTEIGDTAGQGQTINIGSNTNFSGTVAHLNLPIPGSTTSDYVATINWGDNTTSPGTLTFQADGSVLLSGSHTYATGNKSFATSFSLTGGPSTSTTSAAVASPAVGTVTGTLFDDINGNGTMDTGEKGIPDQTVFIDENNNGKLDPGEPNAVTNSAGVYTITNVPAGSIRVSEVVPSGFRVSAPATGSYNVTLNAGQTLSNQNFANTQLALISGTVFVDANGNGKQDPSETGRVNQIVYLDLNNDGVLEPNEPTVLTDATGAFAFTVNPGSYVVRLQPFSDFTITTPAGGAYSVTLGDGATNSGGLFGEKLIVQSLPPPPPGSPPHSPPPPKPPPTLHTPPLLALIDSLLGAVETINSNETETVTDSIFGFPLIVSLYDGAGNLTSVTLFGINITSLFA